MAKAIYLDMDGTIADLYGVEGWLDDLIASRTRPYEQAKPIYNMSKLARALNKAQKQGVRIGVISWLSKSGTEDYNEAVTKAKRKWLKKHLKSVKFDEVYIVPYGTPKGTLAVENSILFDDEERNRNEWNKGNAFPPEKIFEVLRFIS